MLPRRRNGAAAVTTTSTKWSARRLLRQLFVLVTCGFCTTIYIAVYVHHLMEGPESDRWDTGFLQDFMRDQLADPSPYDAPTRRSLDGRYQPHDVAEPFSACLLVMDDNHFLVEWLAYHYYALDLRTVVVAVDPRSQTMPSDILHRWRGKMHVVEWNDDRQYMNRDEFRAAKADVAYKFGAKGAGNQPGSDLSDELVSHRARQRLFYYKCLQHLQERGEQWTMLLDTDEFLTVNHPTVEAYNRNVSTIEQAQEATSTATAHPPTSIETIPPSEQGAVARFIRANARQKGDSSLNILTQGIDSDHPLDILQSSPCLQVPRLRYGDIQPESSLSTAQDALGVSDPYKLRNFPLNQTYDFFTQRSVGRAAADSFKYNRISKTLIDVSRIPSYDLVPVDSVHMPIRSYCTQRRLHVRAKQSFLAIRHYLGTLSQYLDREQDARSNTTRTKKMYDDTQKAITVRPSSAKPHQDPNSLQLWLPGFVSRLGSAESARLLKDAGKLSPKSWQPVVPAFANMNRCALLFFGLPRAFRKMVLPSIVRNILIPNARHNCDVYVHFYHQSHEEAGRKNTGGNISPEDIFLLRDAARATINKYNPLQASKRMPHVAFTHDTEEDFWKKRKDLLDRYQNTKDADGKPAYFPYQAKTYTKSSIDNIVKQWHSIEYAFKLMEFSATQLGVNYTRVGMFRSDAMYLTPLDIAALDRGAIDTRNEFAVSPAFGRNPVNDRMIYGPYQAVRVWATQRFELLEERVIEQPEPGYAMHSERFLNMSVFPAMGCKHDVNRDVCFVRTRADESAIISDCILGGRVRGYDTMNRQELVERIVGHNCTRFKMGPKFIAVGCGEGVEYMKK